MTLLGAGLFALVFTTVRGNVEGWHSPLILGSYALAALLLGGFIASQRRGPAAMVDLTMFRSGVFCAAGISVLALGGLIGALVPLTNFLQVGLGHSALHAGAELLPISGMSFVAAALTARVLATRRPDRVTGHGPRPGRRRTAADDAGAPSPNVRRPPSRHDARRAWDGGHQRDRNRERVGGG